ncbi:hypothetical protein AAK967_00905 [Atopobiaceae bacterium 24-176]
MNRYLARIWRRLAGVAVVLCALLLFAPRPALAQGTPEPADANRRQLVLVVRFANDTAGDGNTGLNAVYPYGGAYRTQYESLLRDLNGEVSSKTTLQTLYNYVKTVSLNQCRLASVTPQYDASTGRVAYLALRGNRGSYRVSESIAADAVAAFNAAYPNFDASVLDGNGDGLADNVLVIPDTGSSAPQVGDACWPRHSNLGAAVSLASSNVKAFDYTLVDTTHLMGVGTLAHETLHVFGARDLYRGGSGTISQGSNMPVGVWDIMAQHGGSKLMWPLAITRADCGWLSLDTVDAGTYTLKAPGSGRQAVAVRSPLSDSEYFVLEYRRANTDLANLSALDTSQSGSPMTIGGSGLLVYRVNPAAKSEGNKGDKDYVYLFRSGETGGPRGDGAGDVRHCQLSLNGRESLGSADLSLGLGDGAITLSDGQNSGLMVRVTGQTDDSVTFTVTKPSSADAGLWTRATDASGACPLPSANVVASDVAASGASVLQAVQVGVGSGAKVSAAVFDGNAWSSLASVVSGQDLKAVAVSGQDRYVLTAAYGSPNRFTLFRQTGSGPWSSVGSVTGSGNAGEVAVVGGTVHVLVEDGGVQAYRLDGSKLAAVGAKIPCGYVAALSMVDAGGTPAVAVADFSASSTGLWRLSGSSWSRVWDRAGAVNGLSSAFVGKTGYLYVKGQDGSAGVVSVGASGTPLYTALPSTVPAALEGSLAASGGALYLAVSAQSGNAVTVWKASPSKLGLWEQVGSRVVGSSDNVGAVAAGTRVYVGSVGGGAASLRWRDVGTQAEKPTVPSDPVKPVATQLTSVAVQGGPFVYNGKAHTPTVTVKAGNTTVPASGYTVSYSNNVNVGTATVTVTGRGAYAGSVKATFAITKAPTPPSPVTPVTPSKAMYRLYNPYTGEHFYTADAKERDNIVKVGWRYEGVGWTAPANSKTPVWRLYNPYVPGGDHHYTTDKAEYDRLVRLGWKGEGVGWYSDDAKGVAVYRQYNPYATTGTHNFTANQSEHKNLVSCGWKGEGIAWYGMK